MTILGQDKEKNKDKIRQRTLTKSMGKIQAFCVTKLHHFCCESIVNNRLMLRTLAKKWFFKNEQKPTKCCK